MTRAYDRAARRTEVFAIAKVGAYIRQHHVGLLALVVALAGTSYAAIKLPAKSVGTKQLKAQAVTAKKIRDGAVGTAAVGDGSLQKGDLATGVIPDGSPNGAAGGDLAGSYPNPTVKGDAIDSAKVADNGLTGADIDESSLSGVNAATVGGVAASGLAGIGRSDGPAAGCSDDAHNPLPGEPCGALSITLPRPARLLVIMSGSFHSIALDDTIAPDEGSDDPAFVAGNCRVSVDGTPSSIQAVGVFRTPNSRYPFASSGVVGPLAAGARNLGVSCSESDGDLDYDEVVITAVALAAD